MRVNYKMLGGYVFYSFEWVKGHIYDLDDEFVVYVV